MNKYSHSSAVILSATIALLAAPIAACNGDVAQGDGGSADGNTQDASPVDAGSATDASDAAIDGGALHWFTTCGAPVCQSPGDAGSSGTPACTTEHAGDVCASAGAECDPGTGCGVLLRCATSDPKLGQGGCPVSTRSAKNDIHYLNEQDLEEVGARLEKIRLATYSYKNDPSKREHLGFIVEDDPSSAAVADGKTSVDLYGYTSMVVAAMKVQSQKLAKQDAELAVLRRKVEALEKMNEAPRKR